MRAGNIPALCRHAGNELRRLEYGHGLHMGGMRKHVHNPDAFKPVAACVD